VEVAERRVASLAEFRWALVQEPELGALYAGDKAL